MSEALMGSYYHSIDAKGRMNFPTKLRDILGETLYITRGMDDCLSVYSKPAWDEVMHKMAELPEARARMFSRFICANACEIIPDKQGRILIPQALRDIAKLEKDVVVIGVLNKAEIWDKAKWEEQNESFAQSSMDALMDELNF